MVVRSSRSDGEDRRKQRCIGAHNPRSPESLPEVPVGRLAAEGARVAFTACAALYVWSPLAASATEVGKLAPACLEPGSRTQYYDLALAGDRVAWGEKTSGLSYQWSLNAVNLATNSRQKLASGTNTLGCGYCDNAGAFAGLGGLLVFGVWHTSFDASAGTRITTETLFRATSNSCPCTAIAYAAAPSSVAPLVALDTDGSNVTALRYGSLVVLNSSGSDLLTSGLHAGGAQIMGTELIILVEGQLQDYDLSTGAFRSAWTMPNVTVGRDCHFYSEPHCPTDAELKLQDAARGLVAYTLSGQLHVLHVGSGSDSIVGYADRARFMDAGLVYSDGARMNVISYSRLRS